MLTPIHHRTVVDVYDCNTFKHFFLLKAIGKNLARERKKEIEKKEKEMVLDMNEELLEVPILDLLVLFRETATFREAL